MEELMEYNLSLGSEVDEIVENTQKERKQHEFEEIHNFPTLAEAKSKARDSGYSYDYRVTADPKSNRKV
jgi:hypothetical protein